MADACLAAVMSFNESEQTGVLRTEIFENFYYIGLFDLQVVDAG